MYAIDGQEPRSVCLLPSRAGCQEGGQDDRLAERAICGADNSAAPGSSRLNIQIRPRQLMDSRSEKYLTQSLSDLFLRVFSISIAHCSIVNVLWYMLPLISNVFSINMAVLLYYLVNTDKLSLPIFNNSCSYHFVVSYSTHYIGLQDKLRG